MDYNKDDVENYKLLNQIKHTENDYSYMVLRLSKNDILAYFGTIVKDFLTASNEFLFSQLVEVDSRKFCWRTYYMDLFINKVPFSENEIKLDAFLEWYKNKPNERNITHPLAEELITNMDLQYLMDNIDFNNLARIQKYGFIDIAHNIDICMGGNDDYSIQQSNYTNCPYPLNRGDIGVLELKLNEDGWIDMREPRGQPFTTLKEILNYQYSDDEHLRGHLDEHGNWFDEALCRHDSDWLFKLNDLWDIWASQYHIYPLRKINIIVEEGSDWLEGMINLDGAFYTETLSEAAVIIQKAWIKARYNCEYKIGRKYINEEIDRLGDEIGLELAD